MQSLHMHSTMIGWGLLHDLRVKITIVHPRSCFLTQCCRMRRCGLVDYLVSTYVCMIDGSAGISVPLSTAGIVFKEDGIRR